MAKHRTPFGRMSTGSMILMGLLFFYFFLPDAIPLSGLNMKIMLGFAVGNILFIENDVLGFKGIFRSIGRAMKVRKAILALRSGHTYLAAPSSRWSQRYDFVTGNNKEKVLKSFWGTDKKIIGYNTDEFYLFDSEYEDIFRRMKGKTKKAVVFYDEKVVQRAIECRVKKESDLCAVMI